LALDGFTNRSNMEYIEEVYERFQQDPDSVDPQWKYFFEGMQFAQDSERSSSASGSGIDASELNVYRLIRTYRDYGHLKANLDPLKLDQRDTSILRLEEYNLSSEDLKKPFEAGRFVGMPGATLEKIIEFLEATYCGTITGQFADCPPEERLWLYKEIENQESLKLTKDQKIDIYKQLARTESLEKFIHTRYVGTKRFSIEGGDNLIPMLCFLADNGTGIGMEEMVIGMAHRGRINVLGNFLGKELENILSEFEGNAKIDTSYEGDVKYHLGFSADRETPNGPCHLSLAFNPSHLEFVGPVAQGMVRVKQRTRKDTENRKKVVPVVIHGDAAFSGQGVVTETLQMSKLEGYKVGGTIHVILNNQVGFTTNPSDSRSTTYSSDMAKAIKAPVLLVNGDDAEACVRAMDMAMKYRNEFGQDIVIDLICYRRFGHNEGDEPAFTQPNMYKVIKKHPSPRVIYGDKLMTTGLANKTFVDGFYQEKLDNLQKTLDDVRANPPESKMMALGGLWSGLRRGLAEDFDESFTGTIITQDKLQPVITALTEEPEGDFALNSKVKRLIGNRKKMIEENKIDWGLAELLSYGSLCVENTPVRLSGQDCKRGTFTHRHAVYFDQDSSEEYCPLAQLNPVEGEFCVYNSSLSEAAVLGFEYGNSSSDPHFLIIWEAQFGDFANGAQVIIDQFIASAEVKWARMSGLVMLLPHGYEGQGPEHSSARLERFMQLCAQENMQVCNLTTPANLFHSLRRQMRRDFRKPLVIMSPKSLLRHPKVHSTMEELTEGHFQEVLPDTRIEEPNKVETLILCSGKVYYELEDAIEEKGSQRMAIARLEQLYPFPKSQLSPVLNGYPKLKRVIWAQEEPKNMGAYYSITPDVRRLMDDLGLNNVSLEYIGRPSKASPATGSPAVHKQEQSKIITDCMEYA